MPLMLSWTDARGRARLRRLVGVATVGSGPDVDVRLDDPSVALRHAVVVVEDGDRVAVSALDPLAALFRNGILGAEGEKLTCVAGDRISFGSVTTLLCTERAAPPE